MNKIQIVPSKKKKIEETTTFDILNLSGDFKKEKNKYKFSLNDSDIRQISNETYEIIDPSNEQAFKILFNGEYKINNINGFMRAKSLIKSLLYKFPDNKEIKTINYWQNEIPEVSGHNRKKLKVLDCPFLCEMNDNSKYIIDLEMQNYFYDGLDLNSLTYGNSLRNASDLPVIIIVLLLKETESNDSFEIMPFKKYLNASEFKPIDDFVYVVCFDLNYISECIDSKTEPELNGFKISTVGKEWIKLLAISTWMKKCYFKDKIKKYPIPKNLNNSDEVKSAIKILSADNNSKLVSMMIKEKENAIVAENTKIRTYIEIWINAFLNGKIPDKTIVPFPEVAPEYLINICKSFFNRDDCKLFLNMLIENQIIEPKKIYNDLLNQF